MNEQFKIKALPDASFRIARISPVNQLAISTTIDFKNYNQTRMLYAFALEHIETFYGNDWVKVKLEDKEVYSPFGIEETEGALDELISIFLDKVIFKTFQKSSE